jgi:DNA-binding MarR family transcriptional regulator
MSSEPLQPNSTLFEKLRKALQASSTRSILFHQTLTDWLGLNITDYKCLSFLLEEGPQTAGRLSDLTGLTTGAVTGVIDRLEKGGYVRREKDPHDRRRVIIEPIFGSEAKFGPLFHSLAEASQEIFSHYTDEQLTIILQFISESNEMMYRETIKLRHQIEANPVE